MTTINNKTQTCFFYNKQTTDNKQQTPNIKQQTSNNKS